VAVRHAERRSAPFTTIFGSKFHPANKPRFGAVAAGWVRRRESPLPAPALIERRYKCMSWWGEAPDEPKICSAPGPSPGLGPPSPTAPGEGQRLARTLAPPRRTAIGPSARPVCASCAFLRQLNRRVQAQRSTRNFQLLKWNQSHTWNGVPPPSRNTPHLGHLPGCFHRRMRWRADTGQAVLKCTQRKRLPLPMTR
jgi:hypothetical protein